MRWRLFAWISLGVNIVLIACWFLAAPGGSRDRLRDESGLNDIAVAQARTNFVVRRQFFSWREVESSDYPTYIANLRQIGCPEQTIRDIIIADVNGMYARKRSTELTTSEQQWWRSEPDPGVVRQANEK